MWYDRKTMSDKQTHSGGCHCGAVRFEVQADFSSAMACNCSMCEKAGSLLVFVPAADFKLLSGEDVLQDYQFNTKKIHHLFCTVCGIKPFGRGKNSKGEEMIA